MDYRKLCPLILEEEPLSRHTTMGVGGPAEFFAFPATARELTGLLDACPDARVLGNGSNVLCPDAGLRGMVISTLNMRALRRLDTTLLYAESGALLPAAAAFAWKLGLSGLEFASGIPGTAGGGLLMNAGAYGGQMSDVVAESVYWHGGEHVLEDHGFAYRTSVYGTRPERVILSVVLRLEPGDPASIRGRMDELTRLRREKQPVEWPSAGSVFKRPKDGYASALIEQCGLKGAREGGAAVSEKHAGFILNTGGATCADVLRLMERVTDTVYRETGIRLEPEVRVLS
ncbi:MAG: UDP-N-acetylmuramate dehydrogenase [Oscillospiraceae bacterium]|nr:UDP-N-acetylmuramate dehydrogenase [Oscillospiraceae bacterium]